MGVDIKLFGYLLGSMNTQVIEYYTGFVTDEFDEKILETVDNFIDFLKNGIGA